MEVVKNITRQLKPDLSPTQKGNKVALPTMEGISFERIENIICLEAHGNYTWIRCKDGRSILVCKTLQAMERSLKSPFQFVRIHRSFTINLDYIVKYVKGKGGHVEMEDGSIYNVAVGKKQTFVKTFQLYFG